MTQPTREGLIRAVRRWDVVALTINGVIGAGIFGLPSEAFARIGVYSLLGFVVCGFAVALITLCFAEVASRFSDTGGPYLYGREAFGPLVGFQVGWTTWLARLTAFAANSNLLVSYLGFFVPAAQTGWARALVITAIILFYTAVNVHGVRDTTKIGNVLTIAKLAPLALFVVAGCFYIDPDAFAAPAAPPAFGEFSSAMLLLIYAFVGFEMTAIPAGEMRDPQRDQPMGLLIGMAIIVSLYLVVQVVAIGTSPDLAASKRPLADAAAAFLGPVGGGILAAGAMISIFGNLGVMMLVSPRLVFAMAERREMPAFIAAVHPNYRTPHFAIYVTSAIMLAMSLTGTFVYAATISVLVRLVTYTVTCAALIQFRRTEPTPARFVAPAGTLLAVLSLILMAWLAMQTNAAQARDTGIAVLLGFVLYALCRRK